MATTIRASIIMRSILMSTHRTCNRTIFTQIASTNHILAHKTNNLHKFKSNYELKYPCSIRFESTQPQRTSNKLRDLDRIIDQFEERCQKLERVAERDFVKTFTRFTKTVQNLIELGEFDQPAVQSNIVQYTGILLRSCGALMTETSEKSREMLAGNLWTFIKEYKIPIDISHYNSLLRLMNENNTNFDPSKLLNEITEAGLTPDRVTYQRLLHQYCVQGDVQGATNLLETMKQSSMDLNETIFASLIIGYSKQEDPPSHKEIFELMNSNGVERGSKSCCAALVACASNFSRKPEAKKDFAELVDIVNEEDIQFSTNEMIDLLICLTPLKQDENVARLLDSIYRYFSRGIAYRNRAILSLIKANLYKDASELYWQHKPSERALARGNLGLFYIRPLSSNASIPVDFVISECNKLVKLGYASKPFHSVYYQAASNGNLSLVRAALNKIGEEDVLKCQYFWPLLAQAKDRAEMIQTLKNDLNPKMNSDDLLETFSNWVWPKFMDNVTELFDINKKELHYDANILMISYLNHAVSTDNVDVAVKFITEAPQELLSEAMKVTEEANEPQHDDDVDDIDSPAQVVPRNTGIADRSGMIARLLDQICQHTKDPELVEKAYKLCQVSNYKPTSRSTKSLVSVYIQNGQFDKAIETFLKLAREHRVSPMRMSLIEHCLEKKDSESLQNIMNALTDIHGEFNALFDLAICCIRCDKFKQAQKIFSSPGFRVKPERVYGACKGFANNGEIDKLEKLVFMSKNMYDISTEYLYQMLLSSYDRNSAGKRALHLWNLMQEEDFHPSKRSLLMIAKVLEDNSIQVPFQKPRGRLQGEIQLN